MNVGKVNVDLTRQTQRLILSDFATFLKMHTAMFACTDAVGRLLTERGRNGTFGRRTSFVRSRA